MNLSLQLGNISAHEARAQNNVRVLIGCIDVRTATGRCDPLTRRPIARRQAGERALSACVGRSLYTP